MFKFLSKIVTATVLVSLTSNAQAQLPPALPAKPQSQPPPTIAPAPTPSAPPTSTTLDLKLLSKALGVFWQGNLAQTESQIVMTIQGKSANANSVKINATAKTIAHTENKFRSELTVSRSGIPSKLTYTIVCDGNNVWMYRPDKHQYSQSTFPEFQAQYYSLLIGISSIFFVSMSELGRKEILDDLAANRSPLKSMPPDKMTNLQGGNRQVDGQNLYVYSYDNKDDRSNFSGFVQPETGILKQVEFTINNQGKDLKIVEKILSHTTKTDSNKQIFRFSPPKGVKKVKSLSSDLLQLI